MKRLIFAAIHLLSLGSAAIAQTAADPNEGARLTLDGTNTFTFKWYGRLGRTYFIQTSLDLISWTYLPQIRPGANLVIPYGLSSTGDRFYLRLRYPYPDIPTDDPANSDFDSDGVGNADELSRSLDPLSYVNSDGDGLPDDWERFWFAGSLAHTGAGNDDLDAFTNAEEFLFGLNPNADDSVTAAAKDLSYDALGRLQTAGAVTYSYDAEGNIETAGN